MANKELQARQFVEGTRLGVEAVKAKIGIQAVQQKDKQPKE
jgi:hypothetical protein